MKKKDISIGIAFILLGIFLDQLVKIIVRVTMPIGKSITIIKNFFIFTHVENTGAAWGGFSGYTIVLIIISLIILGFFIYMYRTIDFKKKMVFSISLIMVISGTIGNLIDRILFQKVTDFFDFYIFGYDFPVFNIADILLVVGFAIFIIDMLFISGRKENEEPIIDTNNTITDEVEPENKEEETVEETESEDSDEGNI